MLPYVLNENSVTVYLEFEPKTVTRQHPSFKAVVNAIRDGDWDEVKYLVDIATAIIKFGKGKIYVQDGDVHYRGSVLHNVLSDRLIKMMGEGFDVEPMLKFLKNLMDNPSMVAREELFLFLQSNAIPLTEDGFFLAYKKVNEDYLDIHSRTFNNSVGSVCEMKRRDVDDNRNNTCSSGLHFCSYNYLSLYGSSYKDKGNDKVMVVKINPADVVSIPSDYDNAKGRTTKYEVVDEVANPDSEYFTRSVYSSDGGEYTPSRDKDERDDDSDQRWEGEGGSYDPEEEFEDFDLDWDDKDPLTGRDYSNYHNVRDADGRFTRK